uniref:Uncharacterized protein n=1 Tax=Candidatus Methanophagaceae archaeon ANME-1 ERB6 TaxID=2759912 RepID=A0A7G9YSP8_9EURY|nr:hypothetical protein EDLMLJLI_00025 [Methanosarcinales archaeon ANME-1 ERB6]
MELIDRVFSQKIAGKYTNLQLFSTNFAPIISTKRVIPHRRWLELVYAMPYLVLRREILNSFKRTMNVFASVKQIWNLFVHLDFPLSPHREKMKMRDTKFKMQIKPVSGIRYPVLSSSVNLVDSRGFYFESSSMELAQPVSHEITRIETESAFSNYPLPIVTQQPPVVSHTPSAVSYRNQDISILSGTSDFIAPIFRSYSFKPASFFGQKTVPNEQLQKSDTALHPYGHLERVVLPNGQKIFSSFESSSMELAQPVSHETTRKETESAFINYRLPIVIQQPPVVSHTPSAISTKNLVTYIPSGTSDFIAPIFRSYSFKPTSFLSQKTVPNERLQKSDTVLPPYGHLERVVLPNGQKIFSSFESSSMELAQPVSHEITRKETVSAFSNYPLPLVTQQPPVVTSKPSAVSTKNLVTYIPSGTSDFIAPFFRLYSFKPTSFLSQQTVPNEQLQKGVTVLPPYEHLERAVLPNGKKIFSSFESSSMELAQPVSHEITRKETESAFSNYPLPLVTQQPPVVTYVPSAVSNNNLVTYMHPSTSDFINRSSFNIINKKNEQMQLGIKKAQIYHTYPKIEHVTSTHTELIKERVIEKKEDIKPLHATPQLPSIDLNRLTDQVYQMLARKIRIERERRGLLCR